MKLGKTTQNIGKGKKPARQKRRSVTVIDIMEAPRGKKQPVHSVALKGHGRIKMRTYALDSEFDTATGLKVLSDRIFGPGDSTASTQKGPSSVYVRVEGPLVQMDTGSLKALRGFTDEEIYSLVVPKRTLARRTAERQPLSVEETDRAVRLARVGKMAETIFGNAEKAHRWLRKSKPSLLGETPLNYLASETGARVVEEMLTRIDHGISP